MSEPAASLRVDKWLWHARFFKTRSLAARHVTEGKLRINSVRISKPSRTVQPGDVLTFPQGRDVRVVRVLALGTRRGPAPEAQTLYDDLSPPDRSANPDDAGAPTRGGPRPTKKDRRSMIKSLRDPLD